MGFELALEMIRAERDDAGQLVQRQSAHIVVVQVLAYPFEAVRAFLKAFAKGAKEAIADPQAAIASLKAKDGLVNVPLEVKRLKLTIDTAIDSKGAREEGFGQLRTERLGLMAEQVAKAYETKNPVPAQAVWNGSFLPSAAELDILPKR